MHTFRALLFNNSRSAFEFYSKSEPVRAAATNAKKVTYKSKSRRAFARRLLKLALKQIRTCQEVPSGIPLRGSCGVDCRMRSSSLQGISNPALQLDR